MSFSFKEHRTNRTMEYEKYVIENYQFLMNYFNEKFMLTVKHIQKKTKQYSERHLSCLTIYIRECLSGELKWYK